MFCPTAFRMANTKQSRKARASAMDAARQDRRTHGCVRVDMLPSSILQVCLEDAPSTAAVSSVLARGAEASLSSGWLYCTGQG